MHQVLTWRVLSLDWLLLWRPLLSLPRETKPIGASHFLQCEPQLVHHEDHSGYDRCPGNKEEKKARKKQKPLDDP